MALQTNRSPLKILGLALISVVLLPWISGASVVMRLHALSPSAHQTRWNREIFTFVNAEGVKAFGKTSITNLFSADPQYGIPPIHLSPDALDPLVSELDEAGTTPEDFERMGTPEKIERLKAAATAAESRARTASNEILTLIRDGLTRHNIDVAAASMQPAYDTQLYLEPAARFELATAAGRIREFIKTRKQEDETRLRELTDNIRGITGATLVKLTPEGPKFQDAGYQDGTLVEIFAKRIANLQQILDGANHRFHLDGSMVKDDGIGDSEHVVGYWIEEAAHLDYAALASPDVAAAVASEGGPAAIENLHSHLERIGNRAVEISQKNGMLRLARALPQKRIILPHHYRNLEGYYHNVLNLAENRSPHHPHVPSWIEARIKAHIRDGVQTGLSMERFGAMRAASLARYIQWMRWGRLSLIVGLITWLAAFVTANAATLAGNFPILLFSVRALGNTLMIGGLCVAICAFWGYSNLSSWEVPNNIRNSLFRAPKDKKR